LGKINSAAGGELAVVVLAEFGDVEGRACRKATLFRGSIELEGML